MIWDPIEAEMMGKRYSEAFDALRKSKDTVKIDGEEVYTKAYLDYQKAAQSWLAHLRHEEEARLRARENITMAVSIICTVLSAGFFILTRLL